MRFPVRCNNGQREIVEIAPIKPSLTGGLIVVAVIWPIDVRRKLLTVRRQGRSFQDSLRRGRGGMDRRGTDPKAETKVDLRDGAALVTGLAEGGYNVKVRVPRAP